MLLLALGLFVVGNVHGGLYDAAKKLREKEEAKHQVLANAQDQKKVRDAFVTSYDSSLKDLKDINNLILHAVRYGAMVAPGNKTQFGSDKKYISNLQKLHELKIGATLGVGGKTVLDFLKAQASDGDSNVASRAKIAYLVIEPVSAPAALRSKFIAELKLTNSEKDAIEAARIALGLQERQSTWSRFKGIGATISGIDETQSRTVNKNCSDIADRGQTATYNHPFIKQIARAACAGFFCNEDHPNAYAETFSKSTPVIGSEGLRLDAGSCKLFGFNHIKE